MQLPQQALRSGELIVEDPAGNVEQVSDEPVPHRVADADPFFAADDDVAGSKDAKLLGDDRLTDPDGVLQLLDAELPRHQQLENSDSDRMGEGLEEGRLEDLELAVRA